MNKSIFTVFAIMIGLTAIIWSGCNDNSPNTEEYIIQIDSIVHPDTINFGEDLSIRFYGPIGPDGCYAFDRMEPEYVEDELLVTIYGIHTDNDVCTQAAVYMNGDELRVSEVPAGDLIIKAIQPDGSNITQNVFVKE